MYVCICHFLCHLGASVDCGGHELSENIYVWFDWSDMMISYICGVLNILNIYHIMYFNWSSDLLRLARRRTSPTRLPSGDPYSQTFLPQVSCVSKLKKHTFKRKIWKQVIFILHLVLTRMPLVANIKPLNDLARCYLLVNNCMHICISPVTIIVPLSPQPKHYIFHHSQLHAPQRDVGQPVDGWSEEAA